MSDDEFESAASCAVDYALDKLAECAVYPGAGRDP